MEGTNQALNKSNFSKDYLESMNYFEKCELLNSNPVLLACHFQHRVEPFFKEMLLIPLSTIGKVTYYGIRIGFRCVAHHMFTVLYGF